MTEPGNVAVLRFFKDGTVLNGGGNYPDIQTAWSTLAPTMTQENTNNNWHGTYTLNGNQLNFTIAPPGVNDAMNRWAGTVQGDTLIMTINDGAKTYNFVRYTP